MKRKGCKPTSFDPDTVRQDAGEFTRWLQDTGYALRHEGTGADVSCGSCTACCRSSMFIHIRPSETDTLKRIPRQRLFQAPGLPEGHYIMGYNRKGECPMLVNGQCSIYKHRPQTCRDYDCRVFAATGIAVDDQAQPAIAERMRSWDFEFTSEEGRREYAWLQAIASFLHDKVHLFPSGLVPDSAVPMALLVIRLFEILYPYETYGEALLPPEDEWVKAIQAVLEKGTPAKAQAHPERETKCTI